MRSKGNIIHYNVGGTVFKVRDSLIAKHPDSMLARIASKEWARGPINAGEDTGLVRNAPFFINGNGDRFKYVLEYLEHGRVTLPQNVSKDAVLDDLDYYGIEVNIAGVFEHPGGIIQPMVDNRNNYERSLKESANELELAASRLYFSMISYTCFNAFAHDGQACVKFRKTWFRPHNLVDSYCFFFGHEKHFDACNRLLSKRGDLFQEYMKEYGLHCANLSTASLNKLVIEVDPLKDAAERNDVTALSKAAPFEGASKSNRSLRFFGKAILSKVKSRMQASSR